MEFKWYYETLHYVLQSLGMVRCPLEKVVRYVTEYRPEFAFALPAEPICSYWTEQEIVPTRPDVERVSMSKILVQLRLGETDVFSVNVAVCSDGIRVAHTEPEWEGCLSGTRRL